MPVLCCTWLMCSQLYIYASPSHTHPNIHAHKHWSASPIGKKHMTLASPGYMQGMTSSQNRIGTYQFLGKTWIPQHIQLTHATPTNSSTRFQPTPQTTNPSPSTAPQTHRFLCFQTCTWHHKTCKARFPITPYITVWRLLNRRAFLHVVCLSVFSLYVVVLSSVISARWPSMPSLHFFSKNRYLTHHKSHTPLTMIHVTLTAFHAP